MENFEFKHGANIVEDERNWKHSDLIGASILPKSGACKLGAYQPSEILMQYKVGICTAIAITQQAHKKYKKKYSSTFQYLIQKKFYDGNWDEGSSGQSALWVANNYGFLPYEILPDLQDINPSITYKEYITVLENYSNEQINTWITQCENKISGYASVNVNDYNALAQGIIDSETGLYCTTTITEDWYKNKQEINDWSSLGLSPISKNLPVAGGHAITIDSFDTNSFNAITWSNTWSSQWFWKDNYKFDNGVGLSNYNTTKPNQAWIIYWNKIPVKPNPVFIFNRDLYYGMANNDVKQLQIRLGMPSQYHTGYFGDLTLNSVVKYQKENNIYPPKGYVGKLTRAKLNEVTGETPPVINNMKNITMILKSKTFWTLVATFLINTVNLFVPFMSTDTQVIVNGLLGFIATYFHINPSQNYNKQ